MFTALDFIQSAKVYSQSPPLDDTSLTTLATETDRALPISTWVLFYNTAVAYHMNAVHAAAESFLTGEAEISFVSGTQEYSIPGNTIKIIKVERDDGDYEGSVDPINIRDRCSQALFEHYYLWGRKIGFTPREPGTDKIFNCFYMRELCKANYGGVVSATGTSLVLPETPTLGATSTLNDYYNGSRIHIVSGPGAGQVIDITDYVASTRTITGAFPTVPTDESVYDIVCDIPSNFHTLIWMHMALQAKGVDGDQMTGVRALYTPFYKQLEGGLGPRQVQEARGIRYVPTPGYDC